MSAVVCVGWPKIHHHLYKHQKMGLICISECQLLYLQVRKLHLEHVSFSFLTDHTFQCPDNGKVENGHKNPPTGPYEAGKEV